MADFNAGASAAAVRAAHAEPTVTFGARVYRGRLLSFEEWLPFYERMLELDQRKLIAADAGAPFSLRPYVALYVDYLKAVFPRNEFMWWAPDPVKAIRELPGNGLKDAFDHFFSHQAHVLGAKMAPPVTPATMPTPSSSASTPAAIVAEDAG